MKTSVLHNSPNDAMVVLAKFVKKVRLDQEMTLDELVTRAGVSRSSLIRLEKNGAGSTDALTKVFAALGVLDLFTSALEPPEKQLTIDTLRKSGVHQRQRGRRRTGGVS